MQFSVKDEVFARFPAYCVGLVVAEGLPNAVPLEQATQLLREAERALATSYTPQTLLHVPSLELWRAAFRAVGINPSRFKTSVEALATRTLKGDPLPSLTPVIDLANAVSLRHLLPLGAHDLHAVQGDVVVGPLSVEKPFLPMGASTRENVAPGEFVYADALEVRTRRWVWRQSEGTKVTAHTTAAVFPIDGWIGTNEDAVLAAMEELAAALHALFGVEARTHLVRREQPFAPLIDAAPRPDTVIAADGGFRMAGTAFVERRAAAAVETGSQPRNLDAGASESTQRPADAIDEVLTRRTVDVVVRKVLEQRLRRGERLRVKFGVDPTGPQLHLGHAVQLRKLREFQQLGHTICLVVGDFTAQIGDASDKMAMRQMLSEEQIYENMKSYRRQIARVLDEDAVEWSYNNDWLGPLHFRDIVGLAANFTVAQMLERENFALRFAASKPIGLQEFMYPLMQGYDSVALKADVEIGGTEQLFNLMAGRTLQQAFGQPPQAVITCALLLGTDGLKMSKTTGNCIFIEDPAKEMYGKVMSITDAQILPYYELCTDVPLADLQEVQAELASGSNPMAIKKHLALEITRLYHGEVQAQKAQEAFEHEVQRKELPDQIAEVVLDRGAILLPDLVVALGLAASKSEARRLAAQHGVRVDGEVQTDVTSPLEPRNGMLVQVGKRKFARVRLQT